MATHNHFLSWNIIELTIVAGLNTMKKTCINSFLSFDSKLK